MIVIYNCQATKLRQKVYGDEHEEVQKSLDYFATVYAEVGKHQYSGKPWRSTEVKLFVHLYIRLFFYKSFNIHPCFY